MKGEYIKDVRANFFFFRLNLLQAEEGIRTMRITSIPILS